jgi:hypothetical protein
VRHRSCTGSVSLCCLHRAFSFAVDAPLLVQLGEQVQAVASVDKGRRDTTPSHSCLLLWNRVTPSRRLFSFLLIHPLLLLLSCHLFNFAPPALPLPLYC